MHQKDYISWHHRKLALQQRPDSPHFRVREVWWAAIGHNVGDEEDGKGRNFARPILILYKFNRNLFYGVPLSTARKRGWHYAQCTINREQRTVLLSHVRDYDSRRLLTAIGVVRTREFNDIQALIQNYFLSN